MARIGKAAAAALAVSALLVSGCGGKEARATTPTTSATPTVSPTAPTPTATVGTPTTAAVTPEPAPAAPHLSDANLLDTASLVRAVGSDEQWRAQALRIIGNRNNPTLDCQRGWLRSLGGEQRLMREWRDGAREAATAVIVFRTPGEAHAAESTVVSWLQDCRPSLAGARQVHPTGALQTSRHDGATLTWRTFTAPAPESCTECDTGWFDTQGVAVRRNRLVMVGLASRVDLQLVDTRQAPFLERALVAGIDRAMG